jgi:ribokinase
MYPADPQDSPRPAAGANSRSPHVVVVGSINLDLVMRVGHLPRPGQTVIGRDLRQSPGGKGANQAVAAARLGARCSLIGGVGDDSFGDKLLGALSASGVETGPVRRFADCPSGVALIGVEDGGQNAITIIPGANGRMRPEDVAACESLVRQADVLLLQLEIPLDTVEAAMLMARRHGVITMLDPAPAPGRLPQALYQADVLCPNESEAESLTGIAVDDLPSAQEAARALRRLGARQALVTLGARGAIVCDEQDVCTHVPNFRVTPTDTTAAGDALAAAVGVALAEGRSLGEAVRFGCAAGALATTRRGAQEAMPTREEVEQLFQQG